MKKRKIWGVELGKLKKWVGYWMIVGVGVVVLIFLITCTWIGVDVRERCKVGQAKYGGDCVEALVETLNDEEGSTMRERNYAIWALGQLGDKRALPVLEKYYTGVIPPREPYDEGISQYELKKAIALVDGGWNATAWVWR